MGEKKRKEHSWLVYTWRVTQGNPDPAPGASQLPLAAVAQIRGSGGDTGAQRLVLELRMALSFPHSNSSLHSWVATGAGPMLDARVQT